MSYYVERIDLTGAAAVAAGTGATWYGGNPSDRPMELVDADFVPGDAITENDTNYSDYTLNIAGNAVRSFDTRTVASGGSGSLTQGQRYSMPDAASLNPDDEVAAAGGAWTFVRDDSNGTGAALPTYSALYLYWREVRS